MAPRHSLLGSAFSLSVTTIGAGVLAIPATFQSDGIGLVALALALVGLFTAFSIDSLVLCMEKLQARSYEELSDELLGKAFRELIRWMLIFYNVGTAVGYIVVIGEIYTPMLPLIEPYFPFLAGSTQVTIALWLFVMLPLSFIPRVSGLHFTSFLAIVATFSISGIIGYRYFCPLKGEGEADSSLASAESIRYFRFSSRALLSLPVLMFSFDCQSLVFQVYTSLDCPSRSDMRKVTATSMFVTSTIYGLVGFFGYASTTPRVHGNILTNYDPLVDHLFAVGQTFYSITVMLAYVLILLPTRDALFQMSYGYSHANSPVGTIPPHANFNATLMLATVCLVLALSSPGFLFIVAVLGAFCSSTLCFTYPALFRQRLHSLGIAPYRRGERLVVTAMIAFGLSGVALGFLVLWSAATRP